MKNANMNSLKIVAGSLLMLFGFSFCNPKEGSVNSGSFEPGVQVIIGSSEYNTSFGYYNTTPESPDGSKIAYTKFLSSPKNDRDEQVPAEIWICNAALSGHKKVADINPLAVHNGARIQWLNNRSFAYEDDSIRIIDTEGAPLIKAVKGRLGHETSQGKILYAADDPVTQLSTIYEYDILNRQIRKLGDVMDFKEVTDLYPSENLREVSNFNILHLQYSQNGGENSFQVRHWTEK